MSAPTAPRPTADYVECIDCARRGIDLFVDILTGQCRRCTTTPTRQGDHS